MTTGVSLDSRGGVDARLPWPRTLLLGFQHVLAMYAGAVVVPLLVGRGVGLSEHQISFLVQADLFTCGVATLLQSAGLGRHLGIRLPAIMGVTFTAVGPMIQIGATLGLPHVFGAILVAGLFVFVAAPYFGRLVRFFPPLVTGSITAIIGFSLLPVAIRWAAGGEGGAGFGAPIHFAIASFVLAMIVAILAFGRGFLSSVAVLVSLAAGSLVALALGHMHLDAVGREPAFSLVTPLWFGVPRFDLLSCLTMIVVVSVSTIESIGVFFALGRIVEVEVTKADVTRGLRAEGLSIALGGCFNSFPYTTFSQNVGLVAITGVKSRHVVTASGLMLMTLGLFPKLAALVAAMPPEVLGGAGVVMFGMVGVAGIQMLRGADLDSRAAQPVAAVAIGLGVGLSVTGDVFGSLPPMARVLLANGIVVGAITAVVLNAVFERVASRK
jgi:xanthine permease